MLTWVIVRISGRKLKILNIPVKLYQIQLVKVNGAKDIFTLFHLKKGVHRELY